MEAIGIILLLILAFVFLGLMGWGRHACYAHQSLRQRKAGRQHFKPYRLLLTMVPVRYVVTVSTR